MKIQVMREAGERETIDILEPVTVVASERFSLNHLHSGNGIDYYFTPDGFYDGMGMAVCVPHEQLPPEDLPALLCGLADVAEGKIRSLADIDAELAGSSVDAPEGQP